MGVTDPRVQVDHKFHNKLDNRKEVLRLCSNSQNHMNIDSYKNTSSKYKGVYWDSSGDKKWIVRIRFKGKQIYLGMYFSEDVAARMYNLKAIELFGEFALLNEVI